MPHETFGRSTIFVAFDGKIERPIIDRLAYYEICKKFSRK